MESSVEPAKSSPALRTIFLKNGTKTLDLICEFTMNKVSI